MLYPRLFDSILIPVFWAQLIGARTLAGEHDFCLGFPLEEDAWVAGKLGLPLDADAGLLGMDAFAFWGASWDKERISEGFDGLDFGVGVVPRDGAGFFSPFELPDEDRSGADMRDVVDGVAGLRVGVADLDPDFEMIGMEGLEVGVEERDLAWAAVGLEEGIVVLEVGVEAREGFGFAGKAGRPVGVAALGVGFRPPDDDEGLLFTAAGEPALVDVTSGNELSLSDAESSQVFSSCSNRGLYDNCI